jgi:hypothetical protein
MRRYSNSVASKKSDVTLKGGCLLSTKNLIMCRCGCIASVDVHITRREFPSSANLSLPGPSTELNPQGSGLPTGSHHWHHRNKEDPHLHTTYIHKSKA